VQPTRGGRPPARSRPYARSRPAPAPLQPDGVSADKVGIN